MNYSCVLNAPVIERSLLCGRISACRDNYLVLLASAVAALGQMTNQERPGSTRLYRPLVLRYAKLGAKKMKHRPYRPTHPAVLSTCPNKLLASFLRHSQHSISWLACKWESWKILRFAERTVMSETHYSQAKKTKNSRGKMHNSIQQNNRPIFPSPKKPKFTPDLTPLTTPAYFTAPKESTCDQ